MVHAIDVVFGKKRAKKDVVSVSIPRVPGEALKKHRQDHEREHLFMMSWMRREPFLAKDEVRNTASTGLH